MHTRFAVRMQFCLFIYLYVHLCQALVVVDLAIRIQQDLLVVCPGFWCVCVAEQSVCVCVWEG